jgi:hypothetical protein
LMSEFARPNSRFQHSGQTLGLELHPSSCDPQYFGVGIMKSCECQQNTHHISRSWLPKELCYVNSKTGSHNNKSMQRKGTRFHPYKTPEKKAGTI